MPPTSASPALPENRPLAVPAQGAGIRSVLLHVVFVLSGIAALLYQLIWQRLLLMIYGSNSESVAMVVTAFMVGLGVGSLLGGAVSGRPGAPLVLLFSGAELLIGAYGVGSVELFGRVGELTAGVGTVGTGALAFLLVCVPTLLMGATLPMLVAHRVRETSHTGRSVSLLYFANTLGAALGAFLAAFVVLNRFGLAGSAKVAAALNVVAAVIVLATFGGRSRR